MSSIPQPINLLSRFGDRYRISFDPAYSPRNVPADKLDPWMMTVKCRAGVVYPKGGDRLVVELENHPKIGKQLRAIEGVKWEQDGDQFQALSFPISVWDKVASLIEPYRKTGPVAQSA